MEACAYCNSALSDKYNFCLNCNRQVRCVHCREMLVPNKPICFVCGKPVVASQDNAEPVNEFTLEEKQTRTTYYKKVQGKLTNTAFGDAASVFSGSPSMRRPIVSVNPVIPANTNHQLSLPINSPELTFDGETVSQESVVPNTSSLVNNASTKDRAALFFEPDGEDALVPIVGDFKGENKGEQQRRYMLLFVHAYNFHFKRAMPSDKLVFVSMRNRSMFDNNCYNYFNSIATQYLVKTDAGYKVSLDGLNKIEEIVHEIEDRTKSGFRDWDKAVKPRNKGSKREDIQEVNSWVDMPLDLGVFDIRSLKKPTHYALFGIWLITKKLEVAKAVKPGVVYEFLKRRFVAISVNSGKINRALTRRYNASFFQKTSEGLFYLTPEGESKVLQWLQGAPVQDFVGDDQDNGDE